MDRRRLWVRAGLSLVIMASLQVVVLYGSGFVWSELNNSGFIEESLLDPYATDQETGSIAKFERRAERLLEKSYLWTAVAGFAAAALWIGYGTFVARAYRPQRVRGFSLVWWFLFIAAWGASSYPVYQSAFDQVMSTQAVGYFGMAHVVVLLLHAYLLGALVFSPKLVRPAVPFAWAMA